jgi:hypothetical protein
MTAHLDVASYALGVLDEHDADRFEEHLAGCAECAQELESLLPVVDLLADVDPRRIDDAGPAGPAAEDPHRLPAEAPHRLPAVEPRGLTAVEPRGPSAAGRSVPDALAVRRTARAEAGQRRGRRAPQLLGVAAAVVLLLALTGGALFAGARWFAPAPSQTAQGGTAPTQVAGERLTATDARTGVSADVRLETRPWGTRVSFAVSRVEGPLTCRLVAVRTDGKAEVVSTWTVPETGYGTPRQPEPLNLQAATALRRPDIAQLQVQSVDEAGRGTALVTVST